MSETPNGITPELESADAQFRSWERLRIPYNAVLILGMLPFMKVFLDNPKFTEDVVLGAVAANICFCAGPVAEGYATLIGLPRKPSRWVIFITGILIALMLEAACIIEFLFPGPS